MNIYCVNIHSKFSFVRFCCRLVPSTPFSSAFVIWLFWSITFEVCCFIRHFPFIIILLLMLPPQFLYHFVLRALSYLFAEINPTSLKLFPGILGFTSQKIPCHDAILHPLTLTAAAIKHNVTTQKRCA